jgi:Fe-S-cluster containining protein
VSDDSAPLSTLPFSDWLRAFGESERSALGIDVPCGGCRGCCTSSYFIPIGPDEKATRARIPKRLLFAAPGRPKGHFLLAYDERGHCAMFKDNACSIYADRPRACRAYDCRVFAATGFSEAGKPAIARQGERWRFAFPAEEDARRFEAVRAAARFLREHAAEFPEGFVPGNATQQAALAIRVHAVFLDRRAGVAETVAGILEAAAGGAPEARGGSPKARGDKEGPGRLARTASRPAGQASKGPGPSSRPGTARKAVSRGRRPGPPGSRRSGAGSG